MGIRTDIEQFIINNNKPRNIERDISIILHYFGFGSEKRPTLQSTATHFSLNERERVRQIVRDKFTSKCNAENVNLNSLAEAFKFLNTKTHISVESYVEHLNSEKIITDDISIQGLLNIFEAAKIGSGFIIVDSDFEEVSKEKYESEISLFIIQTSLKKELREKWKKIKTLPGQVGLVSIEFALSKIGDNFKDVLQEHIYSSPDSLVISKDEAYYIFESRDNIIENSLEKIYAVHEKLPLGALIHGITQTFKKRTQKDPGYPEPEVIAEYLKVTKKIDFKDGSWVHCSQKLSSPLSEHELKLVDFVREKKNVTFQEIVTHFSDYSKPFISKLAKSPFLFEDVSGGRRSYNYSLLESYEIKDVFTEVALEEILQKRLESIKMKGTDIPVNSKGRREQTTLSSILFKNKTVEICGICNKEFPIELLSTSHKKKRSECNEEERLDPNIVMPMCYFGCDQLYENDFIRVVEGRVARGENTNKSEYVEQVIKILLGNELDSKWLRGKDYFKRD